MKCNRACPRAHCLGRNGVTERANLIVRLRILRSAVTVLWDKVWDKSSSREKLIAF
jgi:hypothetical protein